MEHVLYVQGARPTLREVIDENIDSPIVFAFYLIPREYH